MSSYRSALTSFALSAMLLAPAAAHAQQGPQDPQANSLVRQAMQDYQDLEIERALQRLNLAVRACGQSGCSNAALARVHMSVGIVQVGGQQNQSAGVEAMVRALRLDPHAEPDTLLATPEINQAFSEAQRQAGRGGSSGSSSGSSSGNFNSGSSSGNTGRSNPPPASGGGDLLHTPASEQLENTPLPVYVEPASSLNAAHVYVHFKGTGMRQFQRQEMQRVGQGWGVEIPCGQIIQGSIDYYITAVDDVGTTLASTGSEDAPLHVPILGASARRSAPAPSLPGRAPPEACSSGDECPPGMSGPSCRRAARGTGGLGDPCASSSECGEGLRCDAGACAVGTDEGPSGGGEEPGGGSSRTNRDFSRFGFDLGGGVGGAFLSGQMSYAEQFTNSVTRTPECGSYTCYRNIDPGLAPTFWLTANIRYNFTQRIGFGVGLRFQFDTADWEVQPPNGRGTPKSNPMANLLIYGRLYYAFTPNGFARQGVVGSIYVGGGAGQIEPKPGVPASARYPSAHVVSGFGNAHVGGRVEYGLRSGFHVGGEFTLQFMFPTFLFNMDLALLAGFHF